MKNNTSKIVASNLLWRLMERFGAQIVTFVVSIILARLLDPTVYGTIALVTAFNTILQVFVDSGFGNALIQKKDADDLDFSTVFYFNIAMCAILYFLVFFFAPVISAYYNRPDLTLIVRVLSLTLIISGMKNVQQAYVSKHMLFKRFFFATLGGTIGAAIIGITLAYYGFGVWALVAQYLFNLIVDTIILWITVKWRPKLAFSYARLKRLFSYGWKLLVSALINTGYKEITTLIIGKKYSSEDLAFYNRGQQFPNLIITNVNNSIDSVLLPTMSSAQDDKERVKSMTRRAIKTSTYIMMPIMIGLAVCAEPVIRFLLTDKWLPAVFFLRVFCFVFVLHPIQTANLNAIKAVGRSDITLKLEMIKKTIGFIVLFATMFIGVKAMALGLLFSTIISMIVNSWPNKKLLNYSFSSQLKDMLPQIVLSLFMGFIVYFIGIVGGSSLRIFVLQVLFGIIIYLVGSSVFKLESYKYILNVAKSFIKEKKTYEI